MLSKLFICCVSVCGLNEINIFVNKVLTTNNHNYNTDTKSEDSTKREKNCTYFH